MPEDVVRKILNLRLVGNLVFSETSPLPESYPLSVQVRWSLVLEGEQKKETVVQVLPSCDKQVDDTKKLLVEIEKKLEAAKDDPEKLRVSVSVISV